MTNLSAGSRPLERAPLTLVKFLLPLDNDALALPAVLGLIDAICYRAALAHEIVAVDDASRDGTAAEARRFAHLMPVWLLQHGRPLGRAQAFRTALEAGCRDAAADDLLMPLDPRRRPEPHAALQAIAAARAGWEAVSSPAGRTSWRGRLEAVLEQVTVYRAGLIARHLPGFLETAPPVDGDAARQLEQYLLSAGVSFHRLTPPPSPLVGGRIESAGRSAPIGSRPR